MAGTQTAHAADPAPNPPLPDSCGLDIAIVLDLSGSLSANDVAESKKAAKEFVDALEGTPSAVGVYTFSDQAQTIIDKTPISTSNGADNVRGAIDTITRDGGFTNWQAAFQIIPTGTYNAIVFITDGQPNRPSSDALNSGITAANAHKSATTTIIGVGVGAVNEGQIKAISGPEKGKDYYLIENYTTLAAKMEELAKKACDGTLSVVKQVEDVNGDTAVASGWTFEADGDISGATSGTTNQTGAVNFKVDYSDGDITTKTVTVTEQQQPGFELKQQNGQNAVCTANGDPVEVTNTSGLAFSVEVAASATVSCTVINKQLVQADLTLTNDATGTYDRTYEWDLTKSVDQDSVEMVVGDTTEITYEIVATPSVVDESNFVVTGTATLTNPNDFDATDVNVAATLPDAECTVTDGEGLTVPANESVQVDYSCTLNDGAADFTGTVTVDADWDASSLPGSTGAASAGADIDFTTVEPTVINGTVTVYDDKADTTVELNAADGEAVLSYTLEVTANSVDCREFVNTVTLTGDGDYTVTASATTNVCAVEPPPSQTPTPTPTPSDPPTTAPVDDPEPSSDPTPSQEPDLADTGSTIGFGVIAGGLAVIALGGVLLTRGLSGRRER